MTWSSVICHTSEPLRIPKGPSQSPVVIRKMSLFQQISCFNHFLIFPFSVPANLGGSGGKEAAYNVGDPGLIPGSGRCPGEGNGNPLQYSSLENPMDRGACELQSMGSQKSQTRLVTNNLIIASSRLSMIALSEKFQPQC